MLDEYGLRLLAEIGIDVYVPRARRLEAGAPELPAAAARAPESSAGDPGPRPVAICASADILIVGHEALPQRLLADFQRGARLAGLDLATVGALPSQSVAGARGLIVFGEALARELGSAMPAQRQNEIVWVVVADPAGLARSAAKQALWGEIKRLSRVSGLTRRH